MKIRQINTDERKDIETFIHLPFALYNDHPLWVPPLVDGMKSALNSTGASVIPACGICFFYC